MRANCLYKGMLVISYTLHRSDIWATLSGSALTSSIELKNNKYDSQKYHWKWSNGDTKLYFVSCCIIHSNKPNNLFENKILNHSFYLEMLLLLLIFTTIIFHGSTEQRNFLYRPFLTPGLNITLFQPVSTRLALKMKLILAYSRS